ncbi:MAG: L-ribulose-5-phosphate 3-epimerase [Angelakisella sp.]
MNRYQLGLYEKAMPADLGWREKLEAVKAAGFDYLELSIDESDAKLARLDMTEGEIAELCAAMGQTGVYIRTICLSGHRKYPFGAHDPAVRKASFVIMEKAILLAWRLGVRIIQLAGYDVYYEDSDLSTLAHFEESLRKSVQLAAAYGILLGFETMETPFMDTVAKSMCYVKKLGSPYLGVYPDIGNLTNAALLYHHNVMEDLALGDGHIYAAHLKETVPGAYREIPFGTGHTDFTGCIRVLYGMGVRLFTGEFWYVGSPIWEQELAHAASFLREHIVAAVNA